MLRTRLLLVLAASLLPWQAQGDADSYHNERYVLPALPVPINRMAMQGSLEVGIGWRIADDDLARVALTYGVAGRYLLTDDWSVGLRALFVGVDAANANRSDAVRMTALAPMAVLRFMPTSHDSMDGLRLGVDIAVGWRLSARESDHAVADATILIAVARLALGVRYQRSLSSDATTRDAIYIVSERTTPEFSRSSRRSKVVRVGLGTHLMSGWSFGDGTGPMPLGARVELPVVVDKWLIPTASWELLWFPGIDRKQLGAQSVSLGLSFAQERGPWFGGAHVGYALSHGATPRQLGSGPMTGLSVYYLLDSPGWFLGAHARAGVGSSNRELRGVFLSVGGVQIFR